MWHLNAHDSFICGSIHDLPKLLVELLSFYEDKKLESELTVVICFNNENLFLRVPYTRIESNYALIRFLMDQFSLSGSIDSKYYDHIGWWEFYYSLYKSIKHRWCPTAVELLVSWKCYTSILKKVFPPLFESFEYIFSCLKQKRGLYVRIHPLITINFNLHWLYFLPCHEGIHWISLYSHKRTSKPS